MCRLAVLILLVASIARATVGQAPIRWQSGEANTDRIMINGRVMKSITIDGLTLWVSLAEQRLGSEMVYYDKFTVYAGIVNTSERRVEISPDMITVTVVKPATKPLPRETAAHLASSIKRRSAIAGALGQFSAQTATTQSQESGVVSGPGGSATYSGSTTSPDHAARRRADTQATVLSSTASAAGADLISLELKANTILPGRDYAGMLIFARDKKCEEVIVAMSIDGKLIEFPFTWLNEAKAKKK